MLLIDFRSRCHHHCYVSVFFVSTFYSFMYIYEDDAQSDEKRDFLQELEMMKSLEQHPHVVMLHGCCTRTGKPYLYNFS